MHIAQCTLKSASFISFSRAHDEPKLEKESADDYAARTWRSQCHTNEKGNIVIPAMMLRNCIINAAKRLGMKIPGKRNATYTKHFEGGVMVLEDLDIGVPLDQVEVEKRHQPSDGVTGSGKRVWKYHPLVREWAGTVAFHVLDDTITEKVFREVLDQSGKFTGLGRFRPEKRGYYGRFEVGKVVWQ